MKAGLLAKLVADTVTVASVPQVMVVPLIEPFRTFTYVWPVVESATAYTVFVVPES